jgi:hypothetical protein
MGLAMKILHGIHGRLRRLGRRSYDRLGIVGVTGGALLAFAVGLALYAPPLERAARELHASAERTRQLLDEARSPEARRIDPAGSAARSLDWIPEIGSANSDMRRVFEAAQKTRVTLSRGEYSLANAGDAGGVRRYEVILPVRERYSTIKAFVAEVLNSMPHASLAELHIERESAQVEMLDARIRFALFYRSS